MTSKKPPPLQGLISPTEGGEFLQRTRMSGKSDEWIDTASGAAGALGNVVISQIDGLGTPIETWTLWNSWIKSVKYGDLEYGNDELTVLEMEVRYDWAKLETKKTEGSVSTGAAAGAQTFFAVSGE